DRGQEPFHLRADANHGLANHILRPSRSRGGCDQDDARFGSQQMLQTAGDRILIFGAGKHEIGVDAEPLQALPHDVLEQLAGSLTTYRIGVENSDSRRTHGPRLENWAALLQNIDDSFQLLLGHGEGSALYGGYALA